MTEHQKYNFQNEIEQIRDTFKLDFVALALIHPELQFTNKWEYVTGNRSDRYKRIVLKSGKGVAGMVLKTGKPVLISDIVTGLDANDLYNYPIVVAEQLTSFGAIPLYKYNRVKGVLLVAFREGKILSEETFNLFEEMIGSKFGPYYNKEMVKH